MPTSELLVSRGEPVVTVKRSSFWLR